MRRLTATVAALLMTTCASIAAENETNNNLEPYFLTSAFSVLKAGIATDKCAIRVVWLLQNDMKATTFPTDNGAIATIGPYTLNVWCIKTVNKNASHLLIAVSGPQFEAVEKLAKYVKEKF